MTDQPISPAVAKGMIDAYFSYMEQLGVNMKAQTQSVSFKGAALMAWLGKVMPYADELRIFMGAYGKDDPAPDRTTVILWPYKNGEPAKKTSDISDDPQDGFDPYNMGTLNP